MTQDEGLSLEERFVAYERDLAYLKDRQAILDVIARYTHSVDRHDWEMLINDVYHPDGIADHDGSTGSAEDLANYLRPMYHAIYQYQSHFIGNHLCDIDGNVAHAETYVTFFGLMKDGESIQLVSARYVDRLEKRDGQWKIALRRVITDARGTIPTIDGPPSASTRDRNDPSYLRPLTLPPERLARLKQPR